MALDRSKIEALIASTAGPILTCVHLPELDEDVWLRPLTRRDQNQVFAWAALDQGGVVDVTRDSELTSEQQAGMFDRAQLGVLRHALVDEEGKALLRGYDEASRFFNQLSDADARAVLEGVRRMNETNAENVAGEVSIDEGKAL